MRYYWVMFILNLIKLHTCYGNVSASEVNQTKRKIEFIYKPFYAVTRTSLIKMML